MSAAMNAHWWHPHSLHSWCSWVSQFAGWQRWLGQRHVIVIAPGSTRERHPVLLLLRFNFALGRTPNRPDGRTDHLIESRRCGVIPDPR